MKPFLTAYWKNLIMLNYEIKPSVLLSYLPKGTELDFWNNTCYISLVGFMFLNTRIKGLSIPFYKNFEELNLRFYVRFKDKNEWKRGVVFIKEIVPKRMIRFIANTMYGEQYSFVHMKNSFLESDDTFEIKYEWLLNNEWNFIKAIAEKNAVPVIKNSEEEFITEHYWGYTKLSNTSISEYNVVHSKWNIHKVISHDLFCNVSDMYGKTFEEYLIQPKSVFMAQGSAVAINNRRTLKF